MRVHHGLARAVGQVEGFRRRCVADRRHARIRHHIVVRGHELERVAAVVPSAERRHNVRRALEFFRQRAAVRVDLNPVDEFDIGGAAPRGHEPVGRGAAVLVREDHRIAVLSAAAGGAGLVPHQQRDVGEAFNRIRPRVQNWRVRDRFIPRVLFADDLEADVADVNGAEAGGGFRWIDSDRHVVLPAAQVPEQNSIISLFVPAHQHHVRVVRSVDADLERRSLAAGSAPVAALTIRANDGDHFGRRRKDQRFTGARRYRPKSLCRNDAGCHQRHQDDNRTTAHRAASHRTCQARPQKGFLPAAW